MTAKTRRIMLWHAAMLYCSQSEMPLTFGLGKPDEGKTLMLEIIWPGGQRDVISDIKPNQSMTVQQGKGISAEPIVFAGAAPQPSSQQQPSPQQQ